MPSDFSKADIKELYHKNKLFLQNPIFPNLATFWNSFQIGNLSVRINLESWNQFPMSYLLGMLYGKLLYAFVFEKK